MSLTACILLPLVVIIPSITADISNSENSITFSVSNVTVNKYWNVVYPDNTTVLEQIEVLPEYNNNHLTEVLQATNFSADAHINGDGFVYKVVHAYNKHHNLALRPDDIWAAIISQFSYYVNKHAEEFRGKFVNFEGKKTLTVTVPGSLRTAPYDYLTKLMSAEIQKNVVDPELKNWILPNFTTTTENDLVTMGVIFMATTKRYFDYEFNLACGIPRITLEGTVGDWKDLYGRLDKLKEYKLEKWYIMLEPVIKQFVDAREGNVDLDFWQRMVHYEDKGSFSPFVSGWITVFSVFDKDGNWLEDKHGSVSYGPRTFNQTKLSTNGLTLDYNHITRGVVEVDVKINDNGKEYDSLMFAGHLATDIQDEGYTMRPALGWVIGLKDPKHKMPQ